MDAFSLRKRTILQKTDKSTKGSVDDAILPLVDLINSFDDYYTTSSCAGRVLLIEQEGKAESRWLYSSHSPAEKKDVLSALAEITDKPVWLKAESFILHVACRDIESAGRLLAAAQSIGLKRSGITSLGKRIMIEILSSEQLAVPVALGGKVLFDDGQLAILVDEANSKIRQTRERMERLRVAIVSVTKKEKLASLTSTSKKIE